MSDAPRSWRRRWLLRLAVIALAAAAVFLVRQPILRALASQLIVEDPPARNAPILVLGSGRGAEQAIKRIQEHETSEILVVDWRPERAERLGKLPLAKVILREVFVKQGVPDVNIKDLPGQVRDYYQLAASIGDWLSQNPDLQLNVYCARFRSRYVDVVLRTMIGDQRQRVHLQAVAHPDYDEGDWWRRKTGLKDFWQETARLAFAWTHGPPRYDAAEWDADAYERSLQ